LSFLSVEHDILRSRLPNISANLCGWETSSQHISYLCRAKYCNDTLWCF